MRWYEETSSDILQYKYVYMCFLICEYKRKYKYVFIISVLDLTTQTENDFAKLQIAASGKYIYWKYSSSPYFSILYGTNFLHSSLSRYTYSLVPFGSYFIIGESPISCSFQLYLLSSILSLIEYLLSSFLFFSFIIWS